MKKLIMFMLCFACASCGGSSGGGVPFYGGIWDFTGSKVLDDCGSGLPATAGATLTVNQDGRRVVVNSGQIVLEGEVHDEDGFTVIYTSRDANGCDTASAYNLRNASDGVADAGFAIVVRCGIQQCQVGYGGQAVRHGARQHTERSSFELELAPVMELLLELTSAGEAAHLRSHSEDTDLVEEVEGLVTELSRYNE